MDQADISGSRYDAEGLSHSHSYLLPAEFRVIKGLNISVGKRNLFELGCVNGSVAHVLTTQDSWSITGVDPSVEGIEQAKAAYPGLRLDVGSAYDNLVNK